MLLLIVARKTHLADASGGYPSSLSSRIPLVFLQWKRRIRLITSILKEEIIRLQSYLPCGCPSVANRVKAIQARPLHTLHHPRGLDTICFLQSNPHRELGTRFGLRQTLERLVGCSSRVLERRSGTAWATPLEQALTSSSAVEESFSAGYPVLANGSALPDVSYALLDHRVWEREVPDLEGLCSRFPDPF